MGKRKIKAEFALKDICDRFTSIRKEDIEIFSPVYYPIAKIEVDMQEKTFENFEAVQESVLRFVALGFNDENVIADLMGLTSFFVLDMLKLLTSYGHIDQNRTITQLGKDSLAQGQKITIANTKQVFLLDALNCNIIRVDKDLDRTIVEKTQELETYEKYIAFLDHSAGIEKEDIEKTLRETDYSTLRRMEGGMNINVTNVGDVRCIGIRYIKSYMLKMKNLSPVIFVKRYDSSEKGRDRFYWLPFSVETESERDYFAIEDIQIHSDATKQIIYDAYKRIIAKKESEKTDEIIDNKIKFFTEEHFKLNVNTETFPIILNKDSFLDYTNNILRILYSFGKDELYLLVDDDISGNIIIFYPDKGDMVLKECAQYVVKALDKHTHDKVISFTERNLSHDVPVIEGLLSVLKKLIDGE